MVQMTRNSSVIKRMGTLGSRGIKRIHVSPWFGKWVLVLIFYVRFLGRFVCLDPLCGESALTFDSYFNRTTFTGVVAKRFD
jgi:hypothetical protein